MLYDDAVGAIFIIQRLTEKYRSNNRQFHVFFFVELKKVAERVPQKVIWYATPSTCILSCEILVSS